MSKSTGIIVAGVVIVAAELTIFAALCYVAWHFIAKLW